MPQNIKNLFFAEILHAQKKKDFNSIFEYLMNEAVFPSACHLEKDVFSFYKKLEHNNK